MPKSIDMPGHVVAAETITDCEGTFHVDAIADLELAQVGAGEGFFASFDSHGVPIDMDNGQAAAIKGHAIAELQFVSKGWNLKNEALPRAILVTTLQRHHPFDESGKHG